MLFLFAVFLTSAAQTLPTYEFGRVSRRWVGLDHSVGWKDTIPYIAHTYYSMPVRGVLGLALYGVSHADASIFIGIIAVGLAALGIAAGWNKSAVKWFTAAGAAALIYSLGAFTPVHGVFYSLAPMLSKARVSARAIQLVHFAIAVLAAFGFDAVLERCNPAWICRIAWAWLCFGAIILLISIPTTITLDDNILMSGYVALAMAALAFAYQRGNLTRAWLFAGALTLVATELICLQNYPNRADKDRNKYVDSMRSNGDIAAFLKAQPGGPVRAAVNDTDVPSNFGDWHGVDMMQGYVAGVTENLLRHELHLPKVRELFAVGYWISRKAEYPDQVEVFQGETGVKVFRVPSALPRGWVAHGTIRVDTDDELRALVRDKDFDPRHKVVFLNAEPPRVDTCQGDGNVEFKRYHSNRISMKAELACEGLLVVADTFFPGWHATVDGKSTPVLETYGALRGIVVDKGVHEIEMRFRPASVYLGAFLTMLGTVVAGFAWRRS